MASGGKTVAGLVMSSKTTVVSWSVLRREHLMMAVYPDSPANSTRSMCCRGFNVKASDAVSSARGADRVPRRRVRKIGSKDHRVFRFTDGLHCVFDAVTPC